MRMPLLQCFAAAFLLLQTGLASAAASGPVGRIQAASGDVQIISEGKPRAAARGDLVNEGDTIQTGAGASAHLRMIDEGIIALRPNSRIVLDTYRWEGKEDGTERSIVSLLRGGFRTITGIIGRSNKTTYEVRTTTATIGIRGTDHEPYFIPLPIAGETPAGEPGTYNKVNLGETFIRTEGGGTIELSANQVGFAPLDPNAAPVRLPRVPPFMRATALPRGKPDMRSVRESVARDPRRAELARAMHERNVTPRELRQAFAFRVRTAGEDFDLAGQDGDFRRAPRGTALSAGVIFRDDGAFGGNVGSMVVGNGDSILLDGNNNPRIVSDASGFRYSREQAPFVNNGVVVVTAGGPVIRDVGADAVDGVGVKWGVYRGGLRFDETRGVSQALLFNFMLASQATPISDIRAPSAVLLSYNTVLGFTRPVDENRNLGGNTSLTARVLVGPAAPQLVQYNLNVNDGSGRTWNATLKGPQSLQSFSRSPSAPNLNVGCAGACASVGQGVASGLVIGNNAGAMISSYGLAAGGANVVGSVLVRR